MTTVISGIPVDVVVLAQLDPLSYENIWPIVQVVLEPVWPYLFIVGGVAGAMMVLRWAINALRG